MIHIYDGNNYVRRRIEIDPTGQTPRTIFADLMNRPEPAFFVWDAPDGNKARRKVFPDYKAKRPPLKEDIFVGFDQVKNVLKHSRATQISVSGYEADDVIAAMTRHFASKGEKVHIFSNDRDFHQLFAEYPDLVSSEGSLKQGVLFEDIRYHKTLVGDASDCIPGLKGFGEKSWPSEDPERRAVLKAWLDAVVAREPLPSYEFFTKAQENWVADEDNLELLRSFWEIIGFLPMSGDLLAQNFEFGSFDYYAADTYLKAFMQ